MKRSLPFLSYWLCHVPTLAFVPPVTRISSSDPSSSTLLWANNPYGTPDKPKKRREKKNKYAKKSSQQTKDPFELLMEESQNKLEEIKKEKAAKANKTKNKRVKTTTKEIEAFKSEPRHFVFPDNKDIDPNDPASFGFIEIGTVVGAHGVHGEIKVKSSTGFPKRFTEPGVKFFKPQNKRAPRKVVLINGRPSKDDEYIVQLDETKNRDDAKRLRGGTLFVREEEREVGTQSTEAATPKTETTARNDNPQEEEKAKEEEEEFFISDLVGLEVFLQEDSESDNHPFVGTVAGVVLADEMCAIPGLGHDMLEINLPRGRGGTTSLLDELVLIPFVPQLVPRVSIANRSVYIDPPVGLLDLTYVREEKIRIKGFLPAAKD